MEGRGGEIILDFDKSFQTLMNQHAICHDQETKVTHLATKPIRGNMHPKPSLTDCPWRIADDGSLGGVDHGGEVHLREVPIHQLQPVLPQQRGHNGLDLHIGE